MTLFDPNTRHVLDTRPLGAVVRWLSDAAVQAIAVDPEAIAIARTLPTGGPGPAHGLMLTPDRQTAWLNVAGGNYLAVLDLQSGEVVEEITTEAFP